MRKFFRRFRAWVYNFRHPITVIRFDEAPAKGIHITFEYEGSYDEHE